MFKQQPVCKLVWKRHRRQGECAYECVPVNSLIQNLRGRMRNVTKLPLAVTRRIVSLPLDASVFLLTPVVMITETFFQVELCVVPLHQYATPKKSAMVYKVCCTLLVVNVNMADMALPAGSCPPDLYSQPSGSSCFAGSDDCC